MNADASPVGLGAVLVQEQGEELRVISYASRSLSLRTDNGPHFTSEHFTKYLEENGIEHIDELHTYVHKPMVKKKDKTAVS